MKPLMIGLTLSLFAVGAAPWAIANKTNEAVIAQTFIPANQAAGGDRAAASKSHVFAMVLPARTGETFSMLSISLQARDPKARPIPFDVKTARAAATTPNGQQQAISIRQTWIDETGTLWLEFQPSLPPKTQLTLSLQPHQLAAQTVYEYGIAAYADSEYPAAIFVDSGTVTLQ